VHLASWCALVAALLAELEAAQVLQHTKAMIAEIADTATKTVVRCNTVLND
jgi:hypothetical protein